jgi:hypothetical protein
LERCKIAAHGGFVDKLADYFWLLPLAFFGYFAWRYIRTGSITGAFLGGRITNTVGEVELGSLGFTSRVLKVHILETNSDATPQVALAIVSKAPLSGGIVPIKLSREQARQLASLLQRAAGSN